MFKNQSYSINNLLLTNEILEANINKFWDDIFSKLIIEKTVYLMVICKVDYISVGESMGGYSSLGKLRKVNYEDKELFIEFLTSRLGILTDSYTTQPISRITFSYLIKEGSAPDNRALLTPEVNDKPFNHRFNNMVLPISMNPEDFGEIVVDNYIQVSNKDGESMSVHRYVIRSEMKIFTIDVYDNGNRNHITIEGAIELSWIDTRIASVNGSFLFKREIGKSTLVFLDGVRILRKKQLNAKPFRKEQLSKYIDNKFITLDIETIKKNNIITPYLICAYNGKDFISSYANSSLDQKELFNNFMNNLLTFFKDSNRLTVYAHNLSGFDGIFLLKHLLPYGSVKPLIHNGKLISIKVLFTYNGYKGKTLIFKDSMLLLPLSLRKLCKAFKIKDDKGYFPFLLNDILYKGIIPRFEYWTGITVEQYVTFATNYIGKVWSFKDESIKYCKLDCQSLHEILVKFNKLIFSEFKVNINTSLTLPALAMRIYKSQFMPDNTIYQLLGEVERDIRQAYTGGAVDVYIPHNRISSFLDNIKTLFIKLYLYDVNSLYPFIMAKTMMPVGKPIAFEGDIRKVNPVAYGFFYCKITSPQYLEHPILQKRIKTSEGVRTIAGLGNWTGWIIFW